jgi:molybdate transport system ATP-binding protein
MRLKLQEYLLLVHDTSDITIILVSHDIAEIMRMSDEVFVLNHGRIDKSGKPSKVFSGSTLSGKFQVTGEILEITKEDVIYVVSVLCGTEVVKAVITDPASQNLNPGDRVMVVSKSFNPMILKIID